MYIFFPFTEAVFLEFQLLRKCGAFFFFVSDAYGETMKVMEKIPYFLGKFLFQLRFL